MSLKIKMKILAKILFYFSIGLMIFSWSIQALGMSKGYEVVGIALFAHLTIIGIGLAFPVWANITFVVTCLYFSENNNYRKATVLSIVTVLLMIVGCVVAVITDGIAWGQWFGCTQVYFYLFQLFIKRI
ncbi:hypothetical protein HX005_08670 [Acinetobacter sp. R933-2]|uniref:hypothetical protein n=1 Tax=Acinetobacter sp. R933-2 TaxID=2746728 RepID=UPI0025789E6D|nr:hypothetical protein [Acinetobacter sp. R933-2]MDM1247462.1 hypothetical protein [Acinetobacter sp. R933-2]